MTTSGSTIIEMNRDSLIAAALRKIGVLSTGQTTGTEDGQNGLEALNNLVAEFQTLGMPIWARKTYTVPMVTNQSQYVIGVGKPVNTPFPLKVLQAWSVDNIGGARQELSANAIDNFNRLPLESGSNGSPSQFMYQPRINYGELNIWPKPGADTIANRTLVINYMAPFEGFNLADNTPYFPREWNNALIYGLADLLAPEFGVPLNDRGTLKKEADAHLDRALDFGLEQASLTFQPDTDWSRNYGLY